VAVTPLTSAIALMACFKVVPRTGFERNRDASSYSPPAISTRPTISFRSATTPEKFAWYASLNGNRSSEGLQPAIPIPVNDHESGFGGFSSLLYNRDPADQFRLVIQARSDYYQIPKDPNPNDWENQLYDSSGLSDGERENDSYAAFTWLAHLQR